LNLNPHSAKIIHMAPREIPSELTKTKGRILVTGADGFIGSHLVEALVRRGYPVRAFVQYNSFNSWGWLDACAVDVKDNFEVFAGDIRDPHGVKTAMEGCASVIHLAALIAIPFSYHSPDSYVETNVRGTLNILQAARQLNLDRIVHTSTSEVYGTAKFVPITEEHPLRGQSPYSASKIGADQLALSFFTSFDSPVIVVRPFNTYGPRQSARAVIPTIITQIASGNEEIYLGNIQATRDFSYVDDTVMGFVAALEANSGLGEVFNLGCNFEVSIQETCHMIAASMGKQIQIKEESARSRPKNSEVERLLSDNSKAQQVLKWRPIQSGRDGFARGLELTIDWFSNPDNLARYKSGIYNI
jgi:NAD dependent epimerase/dehydratase